MKKTDLSEVLSGKEVSQKIEEMVANTNVTTDSLLEFPEIAEKVKNHDEQGIEALLTNDPVKYLGYRLRAGFIRRIARDLARKGV